MTTSPDASPAGLREHVQRRRPMGRLLWRATQPLLRTIQQARRSQFETLSPPRSGRIVFLGDSITEGGLWDEWFPGRRVLNRGIGGECSNDVLRRLDTAVHDPAAVFLLVGTNDLSAGRPIETIARDVASIVAGIHDRAPDTPVFLQSVMPRKATFREDLRALNDRYRALAATAAATRYVDLWPALATSEGALRPEMTLDNLPDRRGLPGVGRDPAPARRVAGPVGRRLGRWAARRGRRVGAGHARVLADHGNLLPFVGLVATVVCVSF